MSSPLKAEEHLTGDRQIAQAAHNSSLFEMKTLRIGVKIVRGLFELEVSKVARASVSSFSLTNVLAGTSKSILIQTPAPN